MLGRTNTHVFYVPIIAIAIYQEAGNRPAWLWQSVDEL